MTKVDQTDDRRQPPTDLHACSPEPSRVARAGSLLLLIVAVTVTGLACSRDPAGATGEKPYRPASQTASRGVAPPVSEPPLTEWLSDATPRGWVLDGEIEQYTPKSLYEKIDGLAELFLSYDVVGLTFASFQKGEGSDVYLDVYVYDMGTPTNAFGIFSVERLPGEPPVDIGRAAYRSDAGVFVWKGRYYVKVVVFDATDDLADASLALARGLAGALTDSGRPVWGRQVMPRTDRVPGSLRYFKIDAMGLDFMRNTYVAQYRRGGRVVEAFLSRRESADAARAAVAKFAKHAGEYGKGVHRLTASGLELVRCDMGGAFDVILQHGHLVAGVSGVKDPETAVRATMDLWERIHELGDSR